MKSMSLPVVLFALSFLVRDSGAAHLNAIGQNDASNRRRVMVVQNCYYALPGKADEVYEWRAHACDVREKLGFPRGRVLRRTETPESSSNVELPDVIWECEYPTAEAREQDFKAVTANAEFKAVQHHMSTLARRLDRAVYFVEETTSSGGSH